MRVCVASSAIPRRSAGCLSLLPGHLALLLETTARNWRRGGIRTHRTVTRTTVFEFYDSHDGPCPAVAKCVLWFVNFDHAILACNARCYPVPCGWFAIWFAKSLSGYRAEANARVRALWAGLCPHSVPRRGARKAPVIAPSGQLTYRH